MQTFITSSAFTSKTTILTDLSTMRLQSQWLSSNEIRRRWIWRRRTREENNWDAGLTRFKRRRMRWCWKWTMRWKWWRPIFSDSEVEVGHGTVLQDISEWCLFKKHVPDQIDCSTKGARYAVQNRRCHLDAQEQMELQRCSSGHRMTFVCPCQIGAESICGWDTHEHKFHTYHTIWYLSESSHISLWLPAWPSSKHLELSSYADFSWAPVVKNVFSEIVSLTISSKYDAIERPAVVSMVGVHIAIFLSAEVVFACYSSGKNRMMSTRSRRRRVLHHLTTQKQCGKG